ncbi:MAG: ABC transporter permease subunit [candidate division NC10 bacterium]|nr:ABC transporter permease subunit [candidate division NC10 bacterium]
MSGGGRRGWLRLADVMVATLLGFFVFAPLAVLVLLSLTEEWGRAFRGGLTLRWLLEVPNAFGAAIAHSVLIAGVTMAATLLMSAMVAYGVLTRRVHGPILVDTLVMTPLTIPYIVLGLALILAFKAPPFRLHGTVWLLLIGHLMIAMPLGYRTTQAVMEATDLSLVEAARSLGASEWTAVRRVILPLIAPGLVAASLLAFVTSLQNYSLSFMIAPERYKLVPLEIFTYVFAETGAYSNYNLAAAVSLCMMLVLLSALGVVRWLTGQSWHENINV